MNDDQGKLLFLSEATADEPVQPSTCENPDFIPRAKISAPRPCPNRLFETARLTEKKL